MPDAVTPYLITGKTARQDLQDSALTALLGQAVMVYLTTGIRLLGKLVAYDIHTLQIEGPDGTLLVYKHAISTVAMVAPPTPGSTSTAPGQARRPGGGRRLGNRQQGE